MTPFRRRDDRPRERSEAERERARAARAAERARRLRREGNEIPIPPALPSDEPPPVAYDAQAYDVESYDVEEWEPVPAPEPPPPPEPTVAPEPEPVGPEPVAPEPVAPEPVVSEAVASEPVASEPVAHGADEAGPIFDVETLPEPDDEEFATQDWDAVFAEQHRETASPVDGNEDVALPPPRRPVPSRVDAPVSPPEPAGADVRRRATSALSKGRERLRELQGRVPQGVPVPRPARPDPPPPPPRPVQPKRAPAPLPPEPARPELEPVLAEPDVPDTDLFPEADGPIERDLPPEPELPLEPAPPPSPAKAFDPFESATAGGARRPGDRLRLPTGGALRRPTRGQAPPPRLRVTEPGLEQVSRGRRVLAIIALVAAGVAVWFLVSLFQPFKGSGEGRIVVTVPKGASASDIGKLLAARDVVSSDFFFSLRAGLAGKRGSLRSGRFVLKHGMSYGAALDALTTAPAAPVLAKVTIPEGRSRREIVPLVKPARLRGGYLAATKSSPVLKPRNYGGRLHATLEGFLFPATYQIKPGSPASALVAQQLKAFRRNFATIDLAYAKRKHLTRYDVITIASMIEREAAIPRERPLIAAVIYNRLHQRMPLGIDATIRYRLNNWTQPLKVSELRNPTAYNTRLHPGLPPTPIGNPGLASLQAAARPARVSYLYYVVKPCGRGAHAFSSTDAKFQSDVAKYNAAREKAGGRSPTNC
jgi:peptidoglycan lytic transglycosylase G